ncbi:TMhelix containing protein [Vibrio phage 1.052.A._10N.286.46.C3]|nr:TMhelix containing protein [Vibrio phage 1.052.A._10N.286.46.C3]
MKDEINKMHKMEERARRKQAFISIGGFLFLGLVGMLAAISLA